MSFIVWNMQFCKQEHSYYPVSVDTKHECFSWNHMWKREGMENTSMTLYFAPFIINGYVQERTTKSKLPPFNIAMYNQSIKLSTVSINIYLQIQSTEWGSCVISTDKNLKSSSLEFVTSNNRQYNLINSWFNSVRGLNLYCFLLSNWVSDEKSISSLPIYTKLSRFVNWFYGHVTNVDN